MQINVRNFDEDRLIEFATQNDIPRQRDICDLLTFVIEHIMNIDYDIKLDLEVNRDVRS